MAFNYIYIYPIKDTQKSRDFRSINNKLRLPAFSTTSARSISNQKIKFFCFGFIIFIMAFIIGQPSQVKIVMAFLAVMLLISSAAAANFSHHQDLINMKSLNLGKYVINCFYGTQCVLISKIINYFFFGDDRCLLCHVICVVQDESLYNIINLPMDMIIQVEGEAIHAVNKKEEHQRKHTLICYNTYTMVIGA